jgi:Glycine zipper 2TM domain
MNHSAQLSAAATLSALLLLAACGGSAPQTPPAADATADAAALATREADVKAREAELAQREADLAAKASAAQPAPVAPVAAPGPAPRPVVRPESPRPAGAMSAPVRPPPAPKVITIPAGTALNLTLSSDLTTKTAKVGDAVQAQISSDVMVDGRLAVSSGTAVTGKVTNVVSGSNKIGGVPTLGIQIDYLEMANAQRVPVSGEIEQKGKSNTGRDTAKIAGGAVVGAVAGHQVNDKKSGTLIGGLVGGAIGAIAAQKTGTEVKLPAGTQLVITLGAPVEVTTR